MEAFETLIERIAPNLYAYRDRFFTSFAATFEMFGKAGLIAFVVGLFFGVLLVVTQKGGILECPPVFQTLDKVINDYLDSITLQDILDQQRERYANDYVI